MGGVINVQHSEAETEVLHSTKGEKINLVSQIGKKKFTDDGIETAAEQRLFKSPMKRKKALKMTASDSLKERTY